MGGRASITGLVLSYNVSKAEFCFIKLSISNRPGSLVYGNVTKCLTSIVRAKTKREGEKGGNITRSLIKNTCLVKYVQRSRYPEYLPHLRWTSCCFIPLKRPEYASSIWFGGGWEGDDTTHTHSLWGMCTRKKHTSNPQVTPSAKKNVPVLRRDVNSRLLEASVHSVNKDTDLN